MKDDDRAPLRRQGSERGFELVARRHGAGNVGLGVRAVGSDHPDARRPAPVRSRLDVAGVDGQLVQPGVEAGRVLQGRQVPPGTEQRLLCRVLGSMAVAEDPERQRVAAVDGLRGKGREGLLVPAASPAPPVAAASGSLDSAPIVTRLWSRRPRETFTGVRSRRYLPRRSLHDRRGNRADALDLERHLVAGLQVSAEASPRGSRAGSRRRPSRCRETRRAAAWTSADARSSHLPERVDGARPRPARRLHRPAVVRADRRHHRKIRARRTCRPPVRQLVGRHEPRPDRRRRSPCPWPVPGEACVSSRCRSRADQSLMIEVAADRLLAALAVEVDGGRVDERADLQLVVELEPSLAAPRPGRPARAAPTRWRSRRSAAGTRPPGSPVRAAPTSCGRGARTRRSRGTRAGGGSGGRRRCHRRRGRRRPPRNRPGRRNRRRDRPGPPRAGRAPGGRRAWSRAGGAARCRGRGWDRPRSLDGGPPRGRSIGLRNRAPPPGASRLLRRRVVRGRGRDASPAV